MIVSFAGKQRYLFAPRRVQASPLIACTLRGGGEIALPIVYQKYIGTYGGDFLILI